MIDMIRNIRFISGKDAKRLIPTILLSVLDSFLNSGMYAVMIFILIDLADNTFTTSNLVFYTWVLVAIFLVRCITQAIGFTKAQHDGPMISRKLRLNLANHIRSLNLGFFNQNSQGKLNAILTTDISDFETILTHCICDLIKTVAFAACSLVISFVIDWKLGVTIAIIAVISLPLLSLSGKASFKNAEMTRETSQNVVSRILEYITGIKTFRLYNLTGERFERLDHALLEMKKQSVRTELSILPLTISFSVVTSMVIPTSLILGTYFLIAENMDPVSFIAVLLISISLSSMMTALSALYPQVRSLNRAAENIRSVLSEKPFPYQIERIDAKEASISLKNVSFSYNGKNNILNDVSLEAKAGTTTAIIGPSGAGKTTIMSLISRFWDVTKGSITVNGQDIKKISPDALASQIAVVFQDVYLLHDTVSNNIKVGKPDATVDEIVEVAKAAHCHDFIIKMEQGYDTVIGEGGSTLSGGERQRISIARALLKNAPIVLLDETTSSLDADNEREIQRAFKRLMQDKTVFVIAHRLNTILNSDNIIVLEKGQIKESGNHEALIKKGGWYAQMVQEQRQAEKWSVAE